ncbi:MAG: SRPBCC family protein [Steroidobacteraceae bacterium]
MSRLRTGILCALLAATRTAYSAGDWQPTAAQSAALAAGDVVFEGESAKGRSGRARAAIMIDASPAQIWRIMTDCAAAPEFVPRLTRCTVIEHVPEKGFDIIQHEVRYAWFLPRVRYTFRADYVLNQRIDFRRIGGDLRNMQGTWLLRTDEHRPARTLVRYQVELDTGFWLPHSLIERSLRRDLPDTLRALRKRAGSVARPAEGPGQ